MIKKKTLFSCTNETTSPAFLLAMRASITERSATELVGSSFISNGKNFEDLVYLPPLEHPVYIQIESLVDQFQEDLRALKGMC